VKRHEGCFALIAVLFIASLALQAQSGTPASAVPQAVPDNPLRPAPPEQPIPYSHKKHLAMGLHCELCHKSPEPRTQMTLPAVTTCMECHADVATDKPAIQKLTEFAKAQKPVPWVRVYNLLPGVSWSHGTHLKAGMKCEMCHGDVAQLEAMAEVTSVTSMYSCLECHEKNHAKASCNTCHKGPGD
jgi:hypothetical protein